MPGGEVKVKDAVAEVCPPLDTVMDADPGDAMRVALTEAVSWVELTKVVVRLVVFHATVALLAKFEPFTVRVKDPLPATAVAGARLEMAGAAAWIWTVKGSESVKPALTTTAAEPVAIPGGIRKVTWVGLTD